MSKLPDKGEEFTCALCEETFYAGVSKVQATAECERTFGEMVTDDTHESVCDDCWKIILAALEAGGEA